MAQDALNILNEFSLRHTESRQRMLETFARHKQALSHNDFEEDLGSNFDRVTLYRTLKTFLDKGIIHKVLDDNGGVKYALCKNQCSHAHHHHDHVHFKCMTCNLTTCIDDTHIPVFSLPAGYSRLEVNMLVQGICPTCQSSSI